MNVIDILLQLITFLMQSVLFPLLPNDAPLYPLATLQATLTDVQSTMIAAFGGWGVLVPMELIFLIIYIIFTAEITLVGFRFMKYGFEIFAKK